MTTMNSANIITAVVGFTVASFCGAALAAADITTDPAGKASDQIDASSKQPVSLETVLARALRAAADGKPANQTKRSSNQSVSTNSVFGVDDLYCWAPNNWYCVGDDGCFFLFDYLYAPGDYGYCEGEWPYYDCFVQTRYYTCPTG